jgi:hypothetical protein
MYFLERVTTDSTFLMSTCVSSVFFPSVTFFFSVNLIFAAARWTTYTHTYMYVCIYVYMNIQTYTHTHTHTQHLPPKTHTV